MDITKGSLDDISRPASSERSRPGSRVSSLDLSEDVRMNQDRIRALEVLSSEFTETQVQHNIEEDNLDCSLENLALDQDVSVEKSKDPELQKAIMEMKRLDRLLAAQILTEKEVKKQSRELHQRLWKELNDHRHERRSECVDEAENTRLFLALTSNTSKDCSVEEDYVPVFGTQVLDQENDLSCRPAHKASGFEVGVHGKSSNSVKVSPELKEVKQTENSQRVMGKNKHRQDFIKKNIELASSAGSLVPMTKKEKDRLVELLRDIDEQETYVGPNESELASSAGSLKPMTKEEKDRLEELLKDTDEEETYVGPNESETDFSLCSVTTTLGEGYTPQPAEFDQLLHIDAKLQLLLPVEEFLSVRGPYGYRSVSQDNKTGEMGEKVLRDMKESREQEEYLCEIQQQLQLLTQRKHPDSLTEEQLKNLLVECEMALSRSVDSSTEGFPDLYPYNDEGQVVSPQTSTPHLSSSDLSVLLQEACGYPASPDQGANNPAARTTSEAAV